MMKVIRRKGRDEAFTLSRHSCFTCFGSKEDACSVILGKRETNLPTSFVSSCCYREGCRKKQILPTCNGSGRVFVPNRAEVQFFHAHDMLVIHASLIFCGF